MVQGRVSPFGCDRPREGASVAMPQRPTLLVRLISPAKRLSIMRTKQKPESPSERDERLELEAQRKSEMADARDAAVDRLIRENIRMFGP